MLEGCPWQPLPSTDAQDRYWRLRVWPPSCGDRGCIAHLKRKPRRCICPSKKAKGGGVHLTALDGRCPAHT